MPVLADPVEADVVLAAVLPLGGQGAVAGVALVEAAHFELPAPGVAVARTFAENWRQDSSKNKALDKISLTCFSIH